MKTSPSDERAIGERHEMWFHDLFISHATEDKEAFVRPLAEQLRREHVEVWYDEFSLKLGDSLRRSIDLGLARSRFGLVVLSPAFLRKQWTQRELDGLTARETIRADRVILPIWHGVSKDDVLNFSPPLADVLAADSSEGLDAVVRKILGVIRPNGSPLVIARDELIAQGVRPPVVTDEWWLDVVEASNREPCAGFAMQRRHWGRWSFPLPSDGTTGSERGQRLAATALQMAWEGDAEAERISQITPPEEVLRFIRRQPGLARVCHMFPRYLATYVPQLTIRECGGEFEADFDRALAASIERQNGPRMQREHAGSALTTDGLPPSCDVEFALRHPDLGHFDPAVLAGQFVQGELGGPPAALFETFDYVLWFLSDASLWLPEPTRAALTEGLRKWGAWTWREGLTATEAELGLSRHSERGALLETLARRTRSSTGKLPPSARRDLVERARLGAILVGLPESGEALAQRFEAGGFIRAYLRERLKKRART